MINTRVPAGFVREEYAIYMSAITGIESIHLRIGEDEMDFYVDDSEAVALAMKASRKHMDPGEYLQWAFDQALDAIRPDIEITLSAPPGNPKR